MPPDFTDWHITTAQDWRDKHHLPKLSDHEAARRFFSPEWYGKPAMSDPIFVRTRHNYGSYVDWFRLIELSGFQTIYVDEMLQHDSKDTTFVISPVNGEWNTRPKGYTQGRVILYQLEWNWDGEHNDPPCADEIWCGDRWHAHNHGYRYVPMGSHPGLNELSPSDPNPHRSQMYDACFMGYKDPPRRAYMLRTMESDGLAIAPNAWGQERSRLFYKSKCMVAIHQLDNMPTIAPLRMCIAAAHKLAVISEHIEDAGIFTGLVDHFPYADLTRMAAVIIRDPHNRLKEQGEALYQLLCVDYTFRKFITLAL